MIERFRSSGGVAWAAAKPFDPTGSTRLPSQAGAAVALPIRVTDGLGSGVAEVAGAGGGTLGVVAGPGAGAAAEQPAAIQQVSRAVDSRHNRTGPVCLAGSTPARGTRGLGQSATTARPVSVPAARRSYASSTFSNGNSSTWLRTRPAPASAMTSWASAIVEPWNV